MLGPPAFGAAANQVLPANDGWTESLDFDMGNGTRGWGWTFRHEDKDRTLCKPVKGKTLLLDGENRTTGKASIHFRYNSAEALKVRTDIPPPNPRQIYNVLYLPNPPVDVSGHDALGELRLLCFGQRHIGTDSVPGADGGGIVSSPTALLGPGRKNTECHCDHSQH